MWREGPGGLFNVRGILLLSWCGGKKLDAAPPIPMCGCVLSSEEIAQREGCGLFLVKREDF